jgi:branched-chain amino acid transport system ATP-binding protein
MTNKETILSVEHLSMIFGGLVAVNDLSFEARRGEITALIGPNGAGKTTVFNCITGFYKPTQGMMKMKSRSGETFMLERLPDFQVNREAKVARTFQNLRLFSGLTLLENLLVAQHNALNKASYYTIGGLLGLKHYKTHAAEAKEKARYWLDRIGLTARADDPAGDLPYGAQRRLEIARAMCTGPELLCLDEPAAGLNPRESDDLNKLLLSIRDDHNMAILLIEHDMSVVMGISDHVVVLDYGKKISDGTPNTVKNDPAVIRAYLGVEDVEEELKAIAKAEAKPAAKPAVAVASAARAPLPKLAAEFKSDRVNIPPPPVLKLPDEPAPVPAPVAAAAKAAAAKAPAAKAPAAKKAAAKKVAAKTAKTTKPAAKKPAKTIAKASKTKKKKGGRA